MGAKAADGEKAVAAEAAAELVRDGMLVGLGTGSTVTYLLRALGALRPKVVCVATSPRTEAEARSRGLDVRPFEELDRLDIAIDGADEIAVSGWLVKGGGGAHTREKIVAAAADRFVVISSSDKLVDELHAPVPLELLPFGLAATLRAVEPTRLRGVPASPDGGIIADFVGEIGEPANLAARLAATPGVVEHGLFPPEMVAEILVGTGESLERRVVR